MKKTYMTPLTEEVKVNVQQLMQAASSFELSGDSASVNKDNEYETLSRGGSNAWGDDDDED